MNATKSNSKKSLYNSYCNIRIILFFFSLFPALLLSTKGSAQNAILSAGNTVKNANYTLSYSIGEISIATYKEATATLTQGQQQGNLIITSLNGIENSGIQAKAYPNPTSNFVILIIEGNNTGDLEYRLTSVSGSLLVSEKNLSEQQKVPMNQYKSGIYFLTVSNRNNNNIHTFKIIKQ